MTAPVLTARRRRLAWRAAAAPFAVAVLALGLAVLVATVGETAWMWDLLVPVVAGALLLLYVAVSLVCWPRRRDQPLLPEAVLVRRQADALTGVVSAAAAVGLLLVGVWRPGLGAGEGALVAAVAAWYQRPRLRARS